MKSKIRTSLLAILTAASAAVLLPTTGQAATIAYWRFENGSPLADSGPNSLALTATGTAPNTYALPVGSGQGQYFPATIPQTGQTNTAAAQGAGTFGSWLSSSYTVADAPAFAIGTAFTVEAFVNLTTGSTSITRTIVGQGVNETNGSWDLAVTSDSSGLGARNLIFQQRTGVGGWSPINVDSNLQLNYGDDYYTAVSIDFANSLATFYLKNLTTGSALQTATAAVNNAGVYNSTNPLTIGMSGVTPTNPGTSPFSGLIDEVRLSNTNLAQSQLLISVPEPASVALLAAAAGLALVVRRRRR